MAKVVLGKMPANFKPFPVRFPMPDGTEGVIEATFKYRSRKDFGKLLNDMFKVAGIEQPEAPTVEKTAELNFEVLFGETGAKNAEHLMSALVGWNLEEPLTLESLTELCDKLPAGAAALMAAYSAACNEGRLGN